MVAAGDEIDAKVWTLPQERMKAGRAFEVPLSEAACAIIEAMRVVTVEGCDFVFPGRFRYRPHVVESVRAIA